MGFIKTLLSFLFLLGTLLVFSQRSAVSIKADSAITASNGEMKTIMLRIESNSEIPQHLFLVADAAAGVRILSSQAGMNIEPREKLFVAFKIFIEKTHPAGSSIINLQLRDASKRTIAAHKVTLKLQPKRQLRISAIEPQVLINRIGDSLKISAQVTNGGNQIEETEIFATFPQYLGSEIIVKKKLSLEPFSSQKVEFSKIIDRDLLRLEIFTVNIAGTDSNKEFFGNTTVTVQNALGNRRYIDPRQNNYYHAANANHIAWSTSNPFDEFSASHNVDLRSEVNLGNTRATFNMNGTYWQNLDTNVLWQNTWLKLERKDLALQLGNLSSSDLEMSLTGRGAIFSYMPTENSNTSLTTGFIEKSYNIFDPISLRNFPRGNAAFAKSTHAIGENKILDGEVILDTEPYHKSLLVKGGYAYSNLKDVAYDVDLGFGITRTTSIVENSKPSVSLGFNYRKSWEKYTFSSTNYFSSGYYPGNKRGSSVLEQRLIRTFDDFSLYGAYSLNIYDPKYIDPLYQFSSYAERHRAELGANFTIAKRIAVNIISQLSTEQSDVFLGDYFTQAQVKFNSASMAASINYSTLDNKNRFTLAHSQGISFFEGITQPQHIFSYQLNWQHKNLTIGTNYQQGNFLLYEGNRNGSFSMDTNKFSAVATYNVIFLDSKLNVNLTALANLDSQTGNSLAFNSNLNYRLFRKTKVFASFNYNKYSRVGFAAANTYYQMGISQDLPAIGEETVKYKNGAIKVFTFYDLNNNNTYEPETDQPASAVKLKINNTIFISGEDGHISYRKVPYGEYQIKPSENEWYGETRTISLQQKEVFVTMALEKTGTVKGKVRYEKVSKFQYEVQELLAGIPILFLSNNNGKTFTFYTNAQGEYTAYIPVGQYTVTLDSQVLQKNVYAESGIAEVKVEDKGSKTLEDFVLKVREKKVEVKKFGTPE